MTVHAPETPHYIAAPETTAQLDYADLAVIDLAQAQTTEGRSQLAGRVREAMAQQGFFYIVNHGLTPAQTQRMFDVADIPFAQVQEEEKKVYEGRMKQTGSYQGYKLRQYWHIDGGVRDQLEHYNINRDINKRGHPEPLRPFLPEIESFGRYNHFNILHPILRLMALGLELPEETFVNIHGYDAVGETYGIYPRSAEEEEKTKNVWLKGHTDFGTITILYSQPVAALQILTPDGKWKWVRHIDNALVINAGDAMEFLTGGYYRATIHRVIQPPPDQQSYARLGVFYFGLCDDDVALSPALCAGSTVLKRAGVDMTNAKSPAPTMEEWRKARTSAYGQTELKKVGVVEEEVIQGVVVKHYS
ncbi:hypothetical protein BD779DRAFT_1614102 [Infundibulicybe gibba]|nr:hypothetical protein BD779DRAFT_1614102 [Infundibulicybe gibba]